MERDSSNGKQSTLLLDVWLVTHLTGRLLDDALRPVGLTGDEFGLYSLLYFLAPTTPTQISRWTGMAPTTVSGMIRRLGTRGHVSHTTNPDDARSRLLALNEEGRRATVQGATILSMLLPRLEDTLRHGSPAVRTSLRDLDAGLRRLVDAAPHPYTLPPRPGCADDRPSISYRGPHLTDVQITEVQAFIDWLRTRDGRRADDRLSGHSAAGDGDDSR
jgi:DNA-binding MarR family transcriptional regulator